MYGITQEGTTRPIEEQDQTKALSPLLQRITRRKLHAWFDRISRRKHLHPLGWDHASGPETRAGVLLALGTQKEVLGFPNVVVRDGLNLVERVVAYRPALDTTSIQLDVGKRPEPSGNTLQKSQVLMMETPHPFSRPPLTLSHPSRLSHGPDAKTGCHATRPESVQPSHPHP